MAVSLHETIGAVFVPKVTVLLPCDEPKFEPLIVTCVPLGPDIGDSEEMIGMGRAVSFAMKASVLPLSDV